MSMVQQQFDVVETSFVFRKHLDVKRDCRSEPYENNRDRMVLALRCTRFIFEIFGHKFHDQDDTYAHLCGHTKQHMNKLNVPAVPKSVVFCVNLAQKPLLVIQILFVLMILMVQFV